MGVRGLQTFLKNNQKELADGILVTNTSIVIDANNLMFMLFVSLAQDRRSPEFRSDIYSGNHIAYGNVVREFFKTLEKCNITPILIFDGSVIGKEELKDLIATKEASVYKRALEKFDKAKILNESDAFATQEDIFLSQNINVVFRTVANEFGVRRIQAPFEADSHIAGVANDLNCPVLTNDSDFIIYDLKRGFILLDTFDYKHPIVNRTGQTCIDALLFSQAKLTRKTPGLSKQNMPLLSVLLGNDYVESGTFDRVMESICNRYYNGHFQAQSFSHRRIANLLDWLRNRSQQEAIGEILNLVHPRYQQKLESCIRMFLKNYVIEKEGDFKTEIERVYPRNLLPPGTSVDKSPAHYLQNLFEMNVLASSALDMIFKNTHYNYSILDDHTLPTSSIPMFRPFAMALVLLRPKPYTNLTTYRREIQSQADAFNVFDRIKGEFKRLIIRPLESLENFGSLEHLDCYSMILLEPALKKTILMDTFKFNRDELSLMNETLSLVFMEPALSEACTCFMLIKYVALETKLTPKPQFVNAILLTHFYYAALNGHVNRKSIPENSDFGQLLLRLRPHAERNNGKDYGTDVTLYRRIVHMISQLSSAYKGFNIINVLLDNVFPNTRSDKWQNGTLIFRLTKLMRLSQETMEGLCKNLGVLIDISGSVRAQVLCDA